jgi:hypothetical protein
LVDVFLQRLVGNIGLGTHVVTYSIRIPCQTQNQSSPAASSAQPSDNCVASGNGSFSVAIAARSDADLAEALAAYDKDRDSLDGDGFWKPRAAEEALCVAPSPMVVSYLARLIKNGLSDCGVRALEKFRGNQEAERLLVETARSNRTTKAAFALELLGQWGVILSAEDLEQILNENLSHLSVPALNYAAKIGCHEYLSIVSPRTNDADPNIAVTAKRAETLLLRAAGK